MPINVNEKLMAKIISDSKGAENSMSEAAECIALINMLSPCLKRNKHLRYETPWGDKTEIGLYRTLKRFFKELPNDNSAE